MSNPMQPRRPALPGEDVEVGFTPVHPCHRAGQPSRSDERRASSCDAQLAEQWSSQARSVINADGAQSVRLARGVQAVVVVPAKVGVQNNVFRSSDLFAGNHQIQVRVYSVGSKARFVLHRRPAALGQCYMQHASAPQIHRSVPTAQSDLTGLHRAAQESGHASVSSLLRRTAYSPQRTKCAHTAAWWHESQQTRGCLTGTSFSLVCGGFHIEMPRVHSSRRLAGC